MYEVPPQPPTPNPQLQSYSVLFNVSGSSVFRAGGVGPRGVCCMRFRPTPQPLTPVVFSVYSVFRARGVGRRAVCCMRFRPTPQTSTPNPSPQPSNPRPQTPNSEAQTPNPSPTLRITNPNAQSVNPQPPNPKPQTPNPKPHTSNSKPHTPHPKLQTPTFKPQTMKPTFKTQTANRKPRIAHVRCRTARKAFSTLMNSIAASVYDKYSVSSSIGPIRTRCWFERTNTTQVRSNFHCVRVLVICTRPDEVQMKFSVAASECRGKSLKGSKDFWRKAKAKIWRRLSYMCYVCAAADRGGADCARLFLNLKSQPEPAPPTCRTAALNPQASAPNSQQ